MDMNKIKIHEALIQEISMASSPAIQEISMVSWPAIHKFSHYEYPL